MDLLHKAETYGWDKPLFEKLGLEPFSFDIRDKKTREVGTVKRDGATIRIIVEAMPAQFWKFDITTKEGSHFEVSTGSGSLSDYWRSIELIADDMLVVKPKK